MLTPSENRPLSRSLQATAPAVASNSPRAASSFNISAATFLGARGSCRRDGRPAAKQKHGSGAARYLLHYVEGSL